MLRAAERFFTKRKASMKYPAQPARGFRPSPPSAAALPPLPLQEDDLLDDGDVGE